MANMKFQCMLWRGRINRNNEYIKTNTRTFNKKNRIFFERIIAEFKHVSGLVFLCLKTDSVLLKMKELECTEVT